MITPTEKFIGRNNTYYKTFDRTLIFQTEEDCDLFRLLDIRSQLQKIFDIEDFDFKKDEYLMRMVKILKDRRVLKLMYHLQIFKVKEKEDENGNQN